MPPNPASKQRTTVLGRYELLAHLASGGMAEVWLARMTGAKGFGRFFALKRMHRTLASQEKFVRMFLDEAEVASHVQHPNVVPIFELGEEDGELFLVMDLVVGVSFSTMLARSADRGERLPLEAVTQVLCDTALGLHAAHTAKAPDGNALGIVHRDVSPQNVLVGVDGRSRVVDFGIAKALMRSTETQTGELKGKLSYYSPEQALAKPVDARSDVFSLGIVLWEALVGQRLFRSDSPLDTLRRITQDPIPSPASLVGEVPEAIARVALHALTRDLGSRIQSASAFEAELRTASLASGVVPSPEQVTASLEREAGDKIGGLRSLVSRRWTQRHEMDSAAVGILAEGDLESASGVRMSDTLVTPPTITVGQTGPLVAVTRIADAGAPAIAAPPARGPHVTFPNGGADLLASGSATISDPSFQPRRSGAPIIAAIALGLIAAGGGGGLAWVLTADDDVPVSVPARVIDDSRGATLGGVGTTDSPAPQTNSTTTGGTAGPVVIAPTPPAPSPVTPTPVTPVATTTTGGSGQRSGRTRPTRPVVTARAPSPIAAPPPPLRILPPSMPSTSRTPPRPPVPAVTPTRTPATPTTPPRRGVVRDYDED